MPTVQFQEALQALRDGDEQFGRDWQSPVPAERHDGLENEAYAAAYLSNLIRQYPNREEFLVKLMDRQEKRLTNSLEEAIESGIEGYASSQSFHKHVNLTIDAILRPENYVSDIQDLHDNDYARAFIRLEIKALGIGRSKSGWLAIIEAAHAPSRQRHDERGRDEEEGPGWER